MSQDGHRLARGLRGGPRHGHEQTYQTQRRLVDAFATPDDRPRKEATRHRKRIGLWHT